MTEKYLVRVQLIRSDVEGEHITGSFDYELRPSTSTQEPLFIRAEKFYKRIQASFRRAGTVTVTKKERLTKK